MLKIKKGDTVKVITGKDKDKEGKVCLTDAYIDNNLIKFGNFHTVLISELLNHGIHDFAFVYIL